MYRSGWTAIGGTAGVLGLIVVGVDAAASDAPPPSPVSAAAPPTSVTLTAPAQDPPKPSTSATKRGPRETPTTAERARAREIIQDQHRRYPWMPPLSAFGVGTEGVTLFLSMPTADWQRLSNADKAAVMRYVNEQPARARANPEKYTDVPPSAPLYATVIQRVSRVSDDDWFIMGGHLVDNGRDMEEGDILACGDATTESGCEYGIREGVLLDKWKR